MSLEVSASLRPLSYRQEKAKLLEEMIALFAQSPYVSHVFVADADEESCDLDPDLVLAFDSDVLAEMVEALDALMAQTFNLLFPGLFDKNEDGRQGAAFVYLISSNGQLFQVKVLLTASEEVFGLPYVRRAKLSFTNPVDKRRPPTEGRPLAQIAGRIDGDCGLEQVFIEVFHAGMNVQSAIEKRQLFLNYAATQRLSITLRNLMHAALDPEHVCSGWSGFVNVLSSSELGSTHLAAYEALISGSAVHTETTLLSAIGMAISFMKDADSSILERFDEPISFYLRCMGKRVKRM